VAWRAARDARIRRLALLVAAFAAATLALPRDPRYLLPVVPVASLAFGAALARTSHTPSATPPESGMSPALHSVGRRRRTSSTPQPSDLRAPWIHASFATCRECRHGGSAGRRLATSACEKCGLAAWPPFIRLPRRRRLAAACAALLLPGWLYGVIRIVHLGPPPASRAAREALLARELPLYPAVRFLNRRAGDAYTAFGFGT